MKSEAPYLNTMDNKLVTSLTTTRLPAEVTLTSAHYPVIILSSRQVRSDLLRIGAPDDSGGSAMRSAVGVV